MNQLYGLIFRPNARELNDTASGHPAQGGRMRFPALAFVAIASLFLLGSAGANAQATYYSKATATEFNDPASWGTATDGTGASPAAITNADNFVIANSAALTFSGTAAVRQLTISAGSFTLASGTLTVSKASGNDTSLTINTGGTFTLNGGSVVLNGNFALNNGGNFIQSGGSLTIDGNNGGSTASSVPAGTPIFRIGTSAVGYSSGTVTLSGGTITIVDPHTAAAAADSYALYVYMPSGTNIEASAAHTFMIGNGTSTDAGGSANGFFVDAFRSSGRLNFGNLIINNPTGSNRNVYFPYTTGLHGDLTLTGGTFQPSVLMVQGNININGGTYIATNGLYFAAPSGTSQVTNTTPQTVTISSSAVIKNNATTSGTANFNSITIQNSSTDGVTFTGSTAATGQPANSISVSAALEFIQGRVKTTGGTVFVLGTAAPSAGVLTYTAGGFMPGTTFGRWFAATTAGSAITAGVNATSTTTRYPFISQAGANRSAWIERVGPTGASGVLAMTYTEAGGLTTVNLTDTPSGTIDLVANDKWAVASLSGTPTAATSFKLQIQAPGIFVGPPAAASARILQNGAFIGTHQAGTVLPGVQRIDITPAQLTAAPFQVGIATADLGYATIAGGNWNNPAIWNKGSVPSCADAVVISGGHSVEINASGASAKNISVSIGAALTINSGTLTVGCTANNNFIVNNGSLTVNGGTVTLNGNLQNVSGSTFAQTGGDIIIDGNNAGDTATSVASGTPHAAFLSNLLTLSGGTLTIVDPHASATTNSVLSYNNTVSTNASPAHTLRLGNGVSTDPAGIASAGFRLSTAIGSGRLSLGNLQVSTLSGTGRYGAAYYNTGINGNLTIDAGSEFRDGGYAVHVTGDILNNGTYVATGTISFNSYLNGTTAPVTTAQSLSGTGVFANAAASPTANAVSLIVNNNSAAGVTLNVPLKLSGTLTLTAGKLNTSDANLLTLNSTTATALSGGSATAYVNGPLARTIATGNVATNFISFPVGKAAYAPIALAPVTTTATVIKAEAFDTNTGTADGSILNLAANRRWETAIVSGNASAVNVRLGDASVTATNIPVMAPSATGVYTAAFGSSAVYTAGTPGTIQGISGLPVSDYTGYLSYAVSNVCSGTPDPGATLASANSICAGTAVVLSVANNTVGSGVSYQWQSSADGTAYTDISGATSATLTTTPAADTFYQLKVTCVTGPAAATSVPVQVKFATTAPAVTAASRCGVGTVTLNATAAQGANVVWYDAATGGNLIANGNTFTTPSLSATATYYAASQVPTTGAAVVGTATATTSTSGITPFSASYEGSRMQYLIRASELQAAGLAMGDITSLTFNVTSSGTTSYSQRGYTVKIASTTAGAFTGAFLPGAFTTVYGPVVMPQVAVGPKTLTFSQPFAWDGMSNIVVEICHDNDPTASCADCYGSNATVAYTATPFNSVYGKYADDAAMCGTNNGSAISTFVNRPNMTFAGQVACTSARIPVVATVTPAPSFSLSANSVTTCSGSPSAAITVTSGASDYDTFTWSPTEGVSGTAATGFVFSPAVTTTYTLTASQSTGQQCTSLATVAVTANRKPEAITASNSANGPTCLNAVQTLTATGNAINPVLGTGTAVNAVAGYPSPYTNYFGGSKHQMLVRASELTALGYRTGAVITQIAFNVTAVGSAFTGTLSNFQIDMGHTTTTALNSSSFVSGLTTVFPAASVAIPTTGLPALVSHTLATPFTWNGTDNIVIQTSYSNNNTGGTSTFVQVTSSDPGFVSTNWYRADTATASAIRSASSPTASANARPNMVITATNDFTLTWSPATNLYTNAAATIPYVAGSDASTVYVKSGTPGTTAYTVTATNNFGCSVSQTVNATFESCAIDFANIASPATATITTCGTQTVYAQVYKDGKTQAAGAPAGITAWIGVSATNSDPATWSEATWKAATYSGQSGDNDEFEYNIAGLPAGMYYYASRFRYTGGEYYYGGFNGGAWNGTSNVNGQLTVEAVAAPVASAQTKCEGATVASLTASGTGLQWYADATGGAPLALNAPLNAGTYYVSQTVNNCESERTPVAVTIASVQVPTNSVTQPTCAVATGIIMVTAPLGAAYTYSIDGTSFQASPSFTGVEPGSYTLTVKNGAGCTATAAVTINAAPVVPGVPVANATQNFCSGTTVGALVATGSGLKWYADATGGAPLALNAPLNAGTYYVSQSANGCESARVPVQVVINTIVADAPADVAACDVYVLPALTSGHYFTMPGGTGIALAPGYAITSTQEIYVYAETGTAPNCTDENSFTVTIYNSPSVVSPTDVVACNSYVLPQLAVGSYYTGTGGTGTMLAAGTPVTISQTIYVYAQNPLNLQCVSEESFTVTINTLGAPTGLAQQTISANTAADATIEDIEIVAAGTVTWYASQADALAGTAALAAGTQLTNGATYYAVQSNGTCTSAPLAVTVNLVLSKDTFVLTDLRYYPNPVLSKLTISNSSSVITAVEVYNLVGQRVLYVQPNSMDAVIDMSALQNAPYIVKVFAGDKSKDIKVIKN